MNLDFILDKYVPVIIVATLTIGYIIKETPALKKVANAYIPLIVTITGALLGVVISGLSVESFVYGAVSGLASTGLHQAFTQLLNIGKDDSGNKWLS